MRLFVETCFGEGHRCTKFHYYRIQVMGIYKFTLPEAVYCCLQTCKF